MKVEGLIYSHAALTLYHMFARGSTGALALVGIYDVE
jgi:hypothetical protein